MGGGGRGVGEGGRGKDGFSLYLRWNDRGESPQRDQNSRDGQIAVGTDALMAIA